MREKSMEPHRMLWSICKNLWNLIELHGILIVSHGRLCNFIRSGGRGERRIWRGHRRLWNLTETHGGL